MLELLHNLATLLLADAHGGLEGVGEDVELPVVAVGLDVVGALDGADDELQAGLDVLHAHGVRLLLEVGEGRFLELEPLLVFDLDVVEDLLPVKIQVVVVEGVEEPVLDGGIGVLDGQEGEPVGGNGQHQVQHQGLFPLVVPKLGELCIELVLARLRPDQILVLEFPGVAEVVEVLVFPEDRELFEFLHTDLVVGPLEVPVQDIFLSPWPFVSQIVLPLGVQQESLHFGLEFPERGTTLQVVLTLSALEHLQQAEGVEDGMVAAQIGGVLLVALSLMHLVSLIIDMRHKLAKSLTLDVEGRGCDLADHGGEDVIDDFACFLGDDGDLDASGHLQIIILECQLFLIVNNGHRN